MLIAFSIAMYACFFEPNEIRGIEETPIVRPVDVTPPAASIEPDKPTAPVEPTAPIIIDDGLPHDKLFITKERNKYESGDISIVIPLLDLDEPVHKDTSVESLRLGVGLYDYAQLPGEGNRNVSVAGHRNQVSNGMVTDDAPFYYIDLLKDGDYLYLVSDETIYRYRYLNTEIIEEDDWGPIYSQGYSCLTITSCEPIGIAEKRIVVRGELDEMFDFTDDYVYEDSIVTTELNAGGTPNAD